MQWMVKEGGIPGLHLPGFQGVDKKMQAVFSFLLRMVLVVAGVLLAASMLVVMLLLLALWSIRAVWARLTGRILSPFEMRLDPRTGFRYVYRRGGHWHAKARAGAADASTDTASQRVPFGHRLAEVTDVEPKASRS